MSIEKTMFEDGKYTVVQNEGRTTILRYGETWRVADGDKFINAAVDEVKRLRAIVDEVHSWAVCGAIATPTDLVQNLARITAITAPGASVEIPVQKFKIPDGPTATIRYEVRASTGYECEGVHRGVTPETYGQMVGVLNGRMKAVPV